MLQTPFRKTNEKDNVACKNIEQPMNITCVYYNVASNVETTFENDHIAS